MGKRVWTQERQGFFFFFFSKILKAQNSKVKISKWGFIKLQSFCAAEEATELCDILQRQDLQTLCLISAQG